VSNKIYDLIVLGSGGAGYRVAMKAKSEGWDVALINKGLFGGTCSVRGCIPKKVLAGSADIADTSDRLVKLGVIKTPPVMDWAGTIAFKRTFTDTVSSSTEKSLKEAGIDVFVGNPKFVGNLKIQVGDDVLETKKAHIAVGAEPRTLTFEGSEHLITSDQFLEMDELPKKIVFVGGGYVSFEFAHIASRYGAEVTILESGNRSLKMFDPDIIDVVVKATIDAGIEIKLDSNVNRVNKTPDGFEVHTNNGSYAADLVVNGAGRPPAIKDLNLEAANIEYDERRGVKVNEYLQSTSNENVFSRWRCRRFWSSIVTCSRCAGRNSCGKYFRWKYKTTII